jgi:hypothetical protein
MNKGDKQHLEAKKTVTRIYKIRTPKKYGCKEKLKVQSIVEETENYQKNWKLYVERMQDDRLSTLAFK